MRSRPELATAADLTRRLQDPELAWLLAPSTAPAPTTGWWRSRRHRGPRSARADAVMRLARIMVESRWLGDPADRETLHDQLRKALPALVRAVTDADPSVRQAAPYAIWQLDSADGAVLAAISAQAAVETDPGALAGQLRAVDEIGGRLPTGDRALPAGWYARWLTHRTVEVRLAAAAGCARWSPPDLDGDGVDLAGIAGADLYRSKRRWLQGFPWSGLSIGDFAELLADRPEQGLRFALAAYASRDLVFRRTAPATARRILARHRTGPPRLWEAIGRSLADPAIRDEAAALFAAAGDTAPTATFAGRLRDIAALGGDRLTDMEAGASAGVALAGLRDPTVAEAALGWFATGVPHVARSRALPATLAPFGDRAADLVPPVGAALRRDAAGAGFTDGLPDDVAAVAAYVRVLATWGPAAAGAVPDLAELLDTRLAAAACRALGAIGPAAAITAGLLEDLARGERRPPAAVAPAPPWHGDQDAAWAHWRVTGDPAVALDVIGRAVRRGPARADLTHLADLGPHADAYAGDVRELFDSAGPWTRIRAAHAWWRSTGDLAAAVPVLLATLQPLRDGTADAVVREAVRHLGAIGAPHPPRHRCCDRSWTPTAALPAPSSTPGTSRRGTTCAPSATTRPCSATPGSPCTASPGRLLELGGRQTSTIGQLLPSTASICPAAT
ncbi:hypothetical protein AB0K00_43210 [Dactylosporangium sp. NPDC049525]|uniref:hypothetical protein n=1 Tax=Dactylosporangium sp. NPDC049525 TaxID=3154730 RepID=UPI003430FCC0